MNHPKVCDLQSNKWILSQQQESQQWITMEKLSKQFHKKCILRVCPNSLCTYSHRDVRRISPHISKCKNGTTEASVLEYLASRSGIICLNKFYSSNKNLIRK